MNLDFSQIVPYIPFILEGIWVTLKFVIICNNCRIYSWYDFALFKISRIKGFKLV